MGQDYMLHAAVKKYKQLTPIFSRKASSIEDNTLARVHVAPHIRGCVIGYGAMGYEFTWNDVVGNNAKWVGGYYIHKVNFKVALKPNSKIVPDAKNSDEVWLITYNRQTVTYPADIVGKLIPITNTTMRDSKGVRYDYTTFIMEVLEPFKFDTDKVVEKGYYQFIGNVHLGTVYELTVIDKSKYEELKKSVGVTLLNFQEPSFKSW